jgi:hypothetical protein
MTILSHDCPVPAFSKKSLFVIPASITKTATAAMRWRQPDRGLIFSNFLIGAAYGSIDVTRGFIPGCDTRSENGFSMDLTADILLMLCSFSLRVQFIAKAVVYGRVGVSMFPQDIRLREIYAYALLLNSQADEAFAVIGNVTKVTRNIAFLNVCVALQRTKSATNRQKAVRSYLNPERSS